MTAAEPSIVIDTADSNEAGREVVRRTCAVLLDTDGPREVQLFAVGALSAAVAYLIDTAGQHTALSLLDALRQSVLDHGHLVDGSARAH